MPVINTEVMRRALEYAATFNLTVFVHPEDAALAHGRLVHDGEVATRLGLPGIPAIAETIGVARELLLVEETGARLHFCHLSTAAAVEMVRDAVAHGLPVSADVAVHHLHLCDTDVLGFAAECHVRPPLRSTADRDGLRRGVADGVLSVVCSDHEPHQMDDKLEPFAATRPGIAGLETLLPLTLALTDRGGMSSIDVLARLTIGPARVLGVDRGRLALGLAADVCVFDPQCDWTPDPMAWVSHGRNTPFAGLPVRGRVRCTFVDGRLVYQRPESKSP